MPLKIPLWEVLVSSFKIDSKFIFSTIVKDNIRMELLKPQPTWRWTISLMLVLGRAWLEGDWQPVALGEAMWRAAQPAPAQHRPNLDLPTCPPRSLHLLRCTQELQQLSKLWKILPIFNLKIQLLDPKIER